jgi:outer membrane protein
MNPAIAIALTTALATQTADAQPLTLAEAIDRALRVHPQMAQARGDLATAAADRRAAYGNFLPNLNLNSGVTRTSTQRWDPNTNRFVQGQGNMNYSAGFSASLDLFTGFRRWADLRTANAELDAAEADAVSQRYAVIAETKQVFYDAVAARDLVGVSEARVRRAEEQLKTVVHKLQLGLATRSDSLRAALEVGNARLDLLRNRQAYRNATARLARQVGSEAPVEPAETEALARAPTTLDTAALRVLAVERAPAVVTARARYRAAEQAHAAAKSSYWPSLTAAYSNSWAGPESPFAPDARFGNSWSLRFTLSYPLFNGFDREANVARTRAARELAEARWRDARLAAAAQFTEALGALRTAEESVAIAEAGVAAAEEDLRVQQERYRVGASTILEVLTSQAALAQAQTDLVRARLEVQRAIAQLEALLGEPLP